MTTPISIDVIAKTARYPPLTIHTSLLLDESNFLLTYSIPFMHSVLLRYTGGASANWAPRLSTGHL